MAGSVCGRDTARMNAQATIDYQRVAEAIRFLDGSVDRQPTLDEVAEHLGLSRSHLQRTFRRWAGTSPKRFLQYLTATTARERLRNREPVLDSAIRSGLSSPGRLHDLMVTIDAMTPGEVARGGSGLEIRVATHPTALGEVVVAVTERGICLLHFTAESTGGGDPAATVRDRWPNAEVRVDPDTTWAAIAPAFEDREQPVNLHVQGTNLQLRVWEALLTIPAGATSTYGEVAGAVGRPDAVRAVASAIGRNPVAYLIPCHRVIRATGHLGGYAWGPGRKRLLLAREGARRPLAEPG